MTDEQFKTLNDKLDALNENLNNSNNLHYQWAQNIMNQQQAFGKGLGITVPRQFLPYYDPYVPMPSADYPEIFNKYGERMEIFFMSDRIFARSPNSKNSRYIIWDRYNFGNETHFYSHDEIFRPVGKPKRKFAFLMEPRSIETNSYKNILGNADYVEKNFDMLFTFDAQLLNTVKNAHFVPFGAGVYYKNAVGGGLSIDQNEKYFDDLFGEGTVSYAQGA